MTLRLRDTFATKFAVTWEGTATQLKELKGALDKHKGGSRGIKDAIVTRSLVTLQWGALTHYNSAYNFVSHKMAAITDSWSLKPLNGRAKPEAVLPEPAPLAAAAPAEPAPPPAEPAVQERKRQKRVASPRVMRRPTSAMAPEGCRPIATGASMPGPAAEALARSIDTAGASALMQQHKSGLVLD